MKKYKVRVYFTASRIETVEADYSRDAKEKITETLSVMGCDDVQIEEFDIITVEDI